MNNETADANVRIPSEAPKAEADLFWLERLIETMD